MPNDTTIIPGIIVASANEMKSRRNIGIFLMDLIMRTSLYSISWMRGRLFLASCLFAIHVHLLIINENQDQNNDVTRGSFALRTLERQGSTVHLAIGIGKVLQRCSDHRHHILPVLVNYQMHLCVARW